MTAIDRNAMRGLISKWGIGYYGNLTVDEMLEAIEACVIQDSPAYSVILTPEEAERAASWYYSTLSYAPASEIHPADQRVVRKLEASA